MHFFEQVVLPFSVSYFEFWWLLSQPSSVHFSFLELVAVVHQIHPLVIQILVAFQFDNPLTAPLGVTNAMRTSFSQVIYFSFVTMSTLGYGDIVPCVPLALTLTWTQSVIGQFYLAVLVARLVGVLPATVLRKNAEQSIADERE